MNIEKNIIYKYVQHFVIPGFRNGQESPVIISVFQSGVVTGHGFLVKNGKTYYDSETAGVFYDPIVQETKSNGQKKFHSKAKRITSAKNLAIHGIHISARGAPDTMFKASSLMKIIDIVNTSQINRDNLAAQHNIHYIPFSNEQINFITQDKALYIHTTERKDIFCQNISNHKQAFARYKNLLKFTTTKKKTGFLHYIRLIDYAAPYDFENTFIYQLKDPLTKKDSSGVDKSGKIYQISSDKKTYTPIKDILNPNENDIYFSIPKEGFGQHKGHFDWPERIDLCVKSAFKNTKSSQFVPTIIYGNKEYNSHHTIIKLCLMPLEL